MKKLGDQWIEVIDGQEHMVKAVESLGRISSCYGCLFLRYEGDCRIGDGSYSCPVGLHNGIVKDLGILNEGGCLPSPWGGYPKIVRVGKEGFCTYKVRFYLSHGGVYGFTLIEVTGDTRQQAIDAWNRRAK